MGCHWVWECPTNEDPEHLRKVRPAKGIPRQYLRKASLEEVAEKSAGGVALVVPGCAHVR